MMTHPVIALRFVLPLALVLICRAPIIAQSVDPAMLLKPPVDSWLTYHGDYSGQRHSRLSAITPANVHQLTLAWEFSTNQTQPITATPILANGIIYITTPDNLWAVDGGPPVSYGGIRIQRIMASTSGIGAPPSIKTRCSSPRPTRTS